MAYDSPSPPYPSRVLVIFPVRACLGAFLLFKCRQTSLRDWGTGQNRSMAWREWAARSCMKEGSCYTIRRWRGGTFLLVLVATLSPLDGGRCGAATASLG